MLKSNQEAWKNILKFKPDYNYLDDTTIRDNTGSGGAEVFLDKKKNRAVIMTPKYMKTWKKQRVDYDRSGKKQRDVKHDFITREIEEKMFALPSSDKSYWAYVNDSHSRYDLLIFDVLEGSSSQIKQLSVRSGRGTRPMYVNDLRWRKSKNVIMQVEKVVILHHIDDGEKYPDATGPENLVYEGLKRGHRGKPRKQEETAEEEDKDKPYTKEGAENKLKEYKINMSLPIGHRKKMYEDALNVSKLTEEQKEKEKERMAEYFSGNLGA